MAEQFVCASHAAEGLKAISPTNLEIIVAQETVVSGYQDTRTGRSVVVVGGTPQATAAAWLKEINEAENAQAIAAIVKNNNSQGLLVGTMLTGETDIRVHWGRLRDPQKEARLATNSQPAFEKIDEWMAATNKAKSEKELVELVRANYAQGFSNASMFVTEGDLRMKLVVQWIGK